ncbi:MAG: thermopsin family protease [Thermoplasmata archaeon]
MIGSALAVLSTPLVSNSTPSSPAAPTGTTSAVTPVSPPAATAAPAGGAVYKGALGTNAQLANVVKNDEATIQAEGGDLGMFLPPNLHEAPPIQSTDNHIVPLYNIAPAPMGVSDFGLINTTGTTTASTTNTTSLQGFFSTSDPLGVETEEFDFGTQQSYGAQLNSVLVNATIEGQQSFGPSPNAPSGCVQFGPGPVCPNEYWLQNVIGYSPASHTLSFENNIWNFSNPTSAMSENALSGHGRMVGCEGPGVYNCELYETGGASVTISYPFTVALYLNTTRGTCFAGTGGATSCNGQTGIDNEVYFNYTIWNSAGVKVCPLTEPSGLVCGEYDNVFFNSGTCQFPANAGCNTAGAVPEHGPSGRIGSATIQANGTAYDPLGLPNDYEMDWGIGSSSGATTGDVYANATVGINYCQNSNVGQTAGIYNQCKGYTAPPSAYDFGSETGETSSGANGYWSPETVSSGPAPRFLNIAPGNPVAHIVTGPSLLNGLWNATGCAYPCGEGASALDYSGIQPSNAWVGIAEGSGETNQSLFQVAPTFGFWSYWAGSGGTSNPTLLGPDLLLEPGTYTIEVMLSGYTPVMQTVSLTHARNAAPFPTMTPTITLASNPSTGAYTPDWAFSNSDLQNLSVSGAGTAGNPYIIPGTTPTVGAPYGVAGSLSWLFSNLNDYLFIQWIGVYVNQTTAYTQFNPGPTMTMDYPTWQYASLSVYPTPTTNNFQYYFFHTQNVAVVGDPELGNTWISDVESGQVYGVVCNTCANVVYASNTILVADEGIDFTGGGTSATASLPYKAPLVNPNGFINQGAPALQNTRNLVWGNTFVPSPHPGYDVYAPARYAATAESFDRLYNNEFNALATTTPTNLSISDTGVSVSWWNATCVSGYAPLTQATYPGSPNPGNGVCEPTSYSQSIDGLTLTGAVNGGSYVGGNIWAAYGNNPNPYGNLPFVGRTTSETGTAGITATNATATPVFRSGDYAPLITYSVYDPTFKETGLPSSATTTEFQMRIANATGYGWYNGSATNLATNPGCATNTVCLNFYLPTGSYTFTASTAQAGYAANPATGSIGLTGPSPSVITINFGTSYLVTFTESGLPGGTRWYVNITGQASLTSTTTTITIGLPSGSYTYTASTVNKTYAPTYTPSFTVSGAPLGVSVPFSPFTYTATFTESGLGGGDSWYVNISGGPSLSGTSTSLSTQLTNGSYTYTAATSDKRYAPTYTPSFTVNGAPVTESISFASVTYAVTFTESGLPAGDTWYVNITGGPSLSATGATTSLMTSLPNGTYSFSVATNDKAYAASYTPSVTVSGGPASASIVFAPFTYAVTFKETGLPGGTMWSVTVDSVTHSSSTATITGFQEINGTYSYTATVAGNGSTMGSFVVSGAPVTVHVAYYKITFTESGLPTGTTWQVTTNSVTQSSTGTKILFYEANGTYSYTIGTISGYHTVDHGTYIVSGTSPTIHSTFAPTTYTVKFIETGFTSGWNTNWCVTYNSTMKCTTASSILFTGIRNGSAYTYSVGHVMNYSLSGSYTGSGSISGGGGQGEIIVSTTLHWNLVKYTVTFTESGLPSHTSWQVTMDGKTTLSTGTHLSFSVSNGTYAFSVISSGYSSTSNPTSPLTVSGAAVPVAVTFT